MRLLLFLTSDTRLPPEDRSFEHLMWMPVFPGIRYSQTPPHHLHPSSVDKQLLPKTATLRPVLYICLNLCSSLLAGATSQGAPLPLPLCSVLGNFL